ncbi:MAG: hypothetical protein V7749_01225 [Cocleimonas sp.]
MKISELLAMKVVSARYKFISELSLYLGLDVNKSLNIILADYQKNPSLLKGVNIPSSALFLTESRINLIAIGKFECRAYLAQICLDYILKEGYRPESNEDKELVALMFLTRFTVKKLDDAILLIPSDWPISSSNELIGIMKGVLHE